MEFIKKCEEKTKERENRRLAQQESMKTLQA